MATTDQQNIQAMLAIRSWTREKQQAFIGKAGPFSVYYAEQDQGGFGNPAGWYIKEDGTSPVWGHEDGDQPRTQRDAEEMACFYTWQLYYMSDLTVLRDSYAVDSFTHGEEYSTCVEVAAQIKEICNYLKEVGLPY